MADLPEIAPLIAQLRNISGPRDVPWQTFAEMKAARDHRGIQPLIDLFWDYSASHETTEVVEQILADFGPAAVPALIAALESLDMEIRYLATITLGRIADPQAIEPLIRRLGDEEHDVSIEAATVLGKIGEKALPFIIAALSDTNPTIRSYALMALDYFKGPQVNEAILKSLAYENAGVLTAAAGAAGRPGFVKAVPDLIKLLKAQTDDSWRSNQMRGVAANSLGIIGDPRAVDALAAVLTNKSEYLIEAAAKALGRIEDFRAVVPLIKALSTVDSHSKRHYIVQALAAFGDAAKPLIVDALADPDANIRFGAAMALGNIGDENDLAVLEVMAENDIGETFSRAKVKTAAGKAIKRIKEQL